MAAGLELSRLLMEQSVGQQAEDLPEDALDCGTEVARSAGRDRAALQTDAGIVAWQEPAAYQNKARRAFFPSAEGSGDRLG